MTKVLKLPVFIRKLCWNTGMQNARDLFKTPADCFQNRAVFYANESGKLTRMQHLKKQFVE